MKIAIDVDDVVADLMPAWLKRLNKAHGTPADVSILRRYDFWEEPEFNGLDAETALRALTPDIYDEVHVLPGTFLALDILKELNHEVVFLSKCYTKEMALAKMDWIHRHGLSDHGNLISVGKWRGAGYEVKEECRFNILIDDSVENCLAWERHAAGQSPRRALLVARPHNEKAGYETKLAIYSSLEEAVGYFGLIGHHELRYNKVKEALQAPRLLPIDWGNAVSTEMARIESDPLGVPQHDKGAKLDAGKPRVGLMTRGFSRALMAVAGVSTYGAKKYTDDGWMEVPNGVERYTDALHRHLLQEVSEGPIDPESGMRHAAQVAWNALARLELMLREIDNDSL